MPDIIYPIGVVVPGTMLVPVDYSPPTYLCEACGCFTTGLRKYNVDNAITKHCGCLTRKRNYWQSICPHCDYHRIHIGPHRDKVTCHNYDCRQAYTPYPTPSTCSAYAKYLKKRRSE